LIDSGVTDTSLTIRLLGPMQVLVHGRPLPRMRSRKGHWLLALLALRAGRSVEREWLAAALWPDVPQERAAANLRVILSELRRALGSEGTRVKSPGRHTLSVDLAGADVDVRTFDAAIESNNKNEASLKRAVALYRGPLLEDCGEEWVGQERNQREQSCLLALQMLADAAMASGDFTSATGYCRRSLRIDQWGEAALRTLMEALTKSGDRNAALHTYREFSEFLRNDASAAPDAETSALYSRLRAEARHLSHAQPEAPVNEQVTDGTTPREVSGYLPHPLTDLIGRAQERIEVVALLRGSRLVSLTGPGGIGKTRLAIEVTTKGVQDSAAFPDGVWLVALESLSESREIVPQIAAVLGIQEEAGQSMLELLSGYLRTKRLLLVLDNCEHLLDACAHVVTHLLRECARVRILTTSREAMGIMGEAVFPVPSLAAPDPRHLPAGSATLLQCLLDYESVRLFVQRAQQRQKGFVLTQSNALAIAQVCFQLDGIPLAIEFAAARVSTMTVRQITERLNDHLSLLTVGNRTAPPRQKTLRATLDWSYALLSVAEQGLLACLSVFSGGATLPAVDAVCSGAGIEQKQVLDLLTSLVDKSLVILDTRQAEERYYLLETVQQYAAERLVSIGGEEAVQKKHLGWFVALAEEVEPHLHKPEQEIYLRRLDGEYGNVRIALARNAAGIGEAEEGLRLGGALGWFWRMQGRFREGCQFLEAVLAREEARGETLIRAKALNAAGGLANRQGDHEAGQTLYEQGLAISRLLGDTVGVADSLHSLADVFYARGDYEAARTRYEESLTIRRELGDKAGVADSFNSLGRIAYIQGNYESARSLHVESLAISQELGDQRGIGISLNNLGLMAREHGDYDAAQKLYEQCLEIRRDLGDRDEMAVSLNDLGLVAHSRSDFELASTLYERALAIRKELGNRAGIAHSLYCMGTVAHARRDYDAARTLYEQYLAIQQELADKGGIAHALYCLGGMARDQRDYSAARTLFRESLALYQETQHSFLIHVLGALGHVEREVGEYGRANTLYQESLLLRREMGDMVTTACSLEDFANLAARQGQFERAVRLLGSAEALCKTLGRVPPVGVKEEYGCTIAAAAAALNEQTFEAIWDLGQAMTLDQAIVYALEGKSS